MKEKLEAVTGSRKSSVRSTSDDPRPGLDQILQSDDQNGEGGIKKLAENRKLLLEQKLGGGENINNIFKKGLFCLSNAIIHCTQRIALHLHNSWHIV